MGKLMLNDVQYSGLSQWVDIVDSLTAGSTTLTISSNAISVDSTIDVYTDADVDYNSITVANGSVTLTYDAQASDMGVKVRVS